MVFRIKHLVLFALILLFDVPREALVRIRRTSSSIQPFQCPSNRTARKLARAKFPMLTASRSTINCSLSLAFRFGSLFSRSQSRLPHQSTVNNNKKTSRLGLRLKLRTRSIVCYIGYTIRTLSPSNFSIPSPESLAAGS